MKLKDIYAFCVKEGTKADLRTVKQIQGRLQDKKKEYKKLSQGFKKYFDKESFSNPYSDTRILFGDPELDVKSVLIGIDIGVEEILLADQLSKSGNKIDLVISHHPEGRAYAGLYDVMNLQADLLCNVGIDKDIAEDFMKKRIGEVERKLHGANHEKAVDAARLLGVPLMSCHTPADNHVAGYLQKLMDKNKPATLKKVIDLLMKEPEYREAFQSKSGPKIFSGSEKNKAGKIFVDMTGGTQGSNEIYGRLSQLGIKTSLCMHVSEVSRKKMKNDHINVVVAGHIASDNLGINLLLDKLNKKTKLKIYECSGFRRFKR